MAIGSVIGILNPNFMKENSGEEVSFTVDHHQKVLHIGSAKVTPFAVFICRSVNGNVIHRILVGAKPTRRMEVGARQSSTSPSANFAFIISKMNLRRRVPSDQKFSPVSPVLVSLLVIFEN